MKVLEIILHDFSGLETFKTKFNFMYITLHIISIRRIMQWISDFKKFGTFHEVFTIYIKTTGFSPMRVTPANPYSSFAVSKK